MDAQVDSHVPLEVKEKASKWGIPNTETIASINEAIDDLKDPHLKGASSFDELEDLLNPTSKFKRQYKEKSVSKD